MINLKYDALEIKEKREAVTEGLLKESLNINSSKISSISAEDLKILFKYYDRSFFNDWFRNNFKGQLGYELSRRMTKSAGITKCPKNISQIEPEQVRITIAIGVDFFFKFDYLSGSNQVCGIETHTSLEALQIVFEHELIHVLESLLYYKSNCSEQRFKDTAKNMFGHTESYHQIPTNRIIAKEKLGITIGDNVYFLFEGKKLMGVVANINKRATVMVKTPNGVYSDKHGTRYSKYYVPLNALTKQ